MSKAFSSLTTLGSAFVIAGGITYALTSGTPTRTPPAPQPETLCDAINCANIGEALKNDPLFKPYVDYFNHYGPIFEAELRKTGALIQKQQSPSP